MHTVDCERFTAPDERLKAIDCSYEFTEAHSSDDTDLKRLIVLSLDLKKLTAPDDGLKKKLITHGLKEAHCSRRWITQIECSSDELNRPHRFRGVKEIHCSGRMCLN